MKLVNIGFGNVVASNKMVAVISPESAPVKRIITEAKEKGLAIDATYGRKTRSVIICESEHVILSAVTVDVLVSRLNKDEIVLPEEDVVDD
ncbi:MAG: DUF370 domain-containing protein [Clostridia bacterium]|nr:DUF370 domain-containing protein [Clostridia bacterium]